VRSSQVAANEPDIAFDNMLQHEVTLSSDQLNANIQFGRSSHGSDGPSGLATRRVLLHRCLQNEQVRNIDRLAVPATEQLFELVRFGKLFQKILVNGGSEGWLKAHVARVDFIDLHAPWLRSSVFRTCRGLRKRSRNQQVKLQRSEHQYQTREWSAPHVLA
jgi:hypothetical protein